MAIATTPGPESAVAPGTKPVRTPGPVIGVLREAGELLRFSGRALRVMPRSAGYFSEVLRQAAIIIPATSVLLVVMQALIGITTVNFVYFLLKALGATDFTGIGTALTLRVAAVCMFGYVFVSKVCGGIVAELGAMKINQEISALESNGVDPMMYVVGTRLIAIMLFIPIGAALTIVGLFIGQYFDAIIVLQGLTGAGLEQFHWGTQSLGDSLYVFVVAASTALATGLASCFYGLRTSGGPAAVGESVARSVIVNLLIVGVVDMFWVMFWYGTGSFFPIGG
jgi:phospholipid/cholesterol/gamma-HCH transport system permease protein